MASPVVQSTATSSLSTAGTNHVVTLPSGITAGDLIVIVISIGSTAATFNDHADYSKILDENVAVGLKVLYRKATGGESNPTFVSTANTRSAHASFRISGAADPAVQAPQITSSTATGSSTTPNPPSCTPTGGAKDYLFIAFCGSAGEQADDGTYCTVFPTNYINQLEKTCGVAGTNLGGMIAAATLAANTASEDPSTFTVSENNTWRSQTIAIHPDTTITIPLTPLSDRSALTTSVVAVGNEVVASPISDRGQIVGPVASTGQVVVTPPLVGSEQVVGPIATLGSEIALGALFGRDVIVAPEVVVENPPAHTPRGWIRK